MADDGTVYILAYATVHLGRETFTRFLFGDRA